MLSHLLGTLRRGTPRCRPLGKEGDAPLPEASQEALDGHAEEERAERAALGDATDLALHVPAVPQIEEVPDVVDQDLQDARLVQGSDDLRLRERVEGILCVEGDGVLLSC